MKKLILFSTKEGEFGRIMSIQTIPDTGGVTVEDNQIPLLNPHEFFVDGVEIKRRPRMQRARGGNVITGLPPNAKVFVDNEEISVRGRSAKVKKAGHIQIIAWPYLDLHDDITEEEVIPEDEE